MKESTVSQKNVIIVGGGFAGLTAAKILGNKKKLHVTVIDRRNYHLFQPLLYQVATAGLSPADIASPIRSILSQYKNTDVFLGEVIDVDKEKKLIKTKNETMGFDYLILACGANHSYFGHGDWEGLAPGLKNLEQATEIRRRVLLAFEQAEKEKDLEKQKRWLTFVVVGAGPTGVELAGAIGEISRYTLEKDFRHIDPSRTRVLLVEAGSRILNGFDETLSKRAARDLENLGVQIWTGTRVSNITEDGVTLGEESVRAGTVIWAAGVAPSPLGKTLNVPLDRLGRVIVEKDLTLKDHPNIFVLGDQAHVDFKGETLPGLAPVAMQEGRYAAQCILADVQGKPRKEFQYYDKGVMATIGRKKAIVQFKGLKFTGFFAWLMWLVVHIYYLIGFKNRLMVFLEWSWSYFTFRRGARLIVEKDIR